VKSFDFADVGIASWKRWCSQNNVRLEIASKLPLPEECCRSASQIEILLAFPPTIQRWLLPPFFLRQHGPGTSVAMIDADTLINPTSPSIFKQQSSDLILTRCQEWTAWNSRSCSAFTPLFPDMNLDPALYFNAGVMVHRTPLLATSFIDFVLDNHDKLLKLLSILDEPIGTDQTPLNFLLQRLKKNTNLSISWLDSRWNAQMDILLNKVTHDQSKWADLAPRVATENFISHFIGTKPLMASTERFLRQ
jgi:hypothetical protein